MFISKQTTRSDIVSFLTSIPCKKRPVMGKKWQGTKVLTLPQKMENGNGNGKTPIYANMKGGT